MVFKEVFYYSVIAIVGFFLGVMLLMLFIAGFMALSDFCCGTNMLGRKNIQGTQYTAPTTFTNVTSTHHTFYQSDIRRNSGDLDVELPMCNPRYSYPMPAPEVRRNAMPSTTSGTNHVHESRSNQVPETPLPRNHADISSAVNTEDLPPSYDEVVGNT